MSDFVSGFWNIYVMGIVALSILACAWLLWANTIKRTNAPVELHGHTWDEDLQEYNHPLPRWWMWLFYITIVFSIVYLIVYPGFGAFPGGFGWSSKGQYEAEMKKAEEMYAPKFNKFLKMDIQTVAADPEAKAMGERMYQSYCSVCHGSDAKGTKGFPNLTDADWLYGGTGEAIKASILDGRNGIMPPFGPALGAEGVKDAANYVRSLSGLSADSARLERGKAIFQQNCAACHGPEGKGMQALGAPNLTDQVWLYSSAEAAIMETITKGRNNRMPAHKEFLGDAKVHLLAAYVYGLGGGEKPAPVAAATPAQTGDAGAGGPPVAKLYFDTGKAELPADGASVLKSIIDYAGAHVEAKLAISGFHDATGSVATNEELAKRRAFAVRDALKAGGVAEERIEMRKPQATTGTGDNAEARRVEVTVL